MSDELDRYKDHLGLTKTEEGVEWKLANRKVRGVERLSWVHGKKVRMASSDEIDRILKGESDGDGPAGTKTTKLSVDDVKTDEEPKEPTTLVAALAEEEGDYQKALEKIREAKKGTLRLSVDGNLLPPAVINEDMVVDGGARVCAFSIIVGG